jgi:hypothetical protein
MIPIEYGMPDEKLIEAAERGEAVIGGCIIEPTNPDFVCQGPECHQWQRDADRGLVAMEPLGPGV